MDRHLTNKAVTAGLLAFATKANLIAEVDENRIEGGNGGGRGAGKTQTARKPIGIEKAAFRVTIRLRAELRGEILGTPGHADQARARARKCANQEQSRRGLGSDRQNLDVSVREIV